jgi:hypothetical protein
VIVIGLKEVDATEVLRQVLDAGAPLTIVPGSTESRATSDEVSFALRPDVGLSVDAFVQHISLSKGAVLPPEIVLPPIVRGELIPPRAPPLHADASRRLPPLPTLAQSWQAAAAYAREKGEDVDALVASAATTIDAWQNRRSATVGAETFAHDEVVAKNYRKN